MAIYADKTSLEEEYLNNFTSYSNSDKNVMPAKKRNRKNGQP